MSLNKDGENPNQSDKAKSNGRSRTSNTAAYWQQQFDDDSVRHDMTEEQEPQQPYSRSGADNSVSRGPRTQVLATTCATEAASRRPQAKGTAEPSRDTTTCVTSTSTTDAGNASSSQSNTMRDSVLEQKQNIRASMQRIAELERRLLILAQQGDEEVAHYRGHTPSITHSRDAPQLQQQQQDLALQPGAWSVPGPSFTRRRERNTSTLATTTAADLPTIATDATDAWDAQFLMHGGGTSSPSTRQLPRESSLLEQQVPPTADVLVVAAVVVDEDQLEIERDALLLKHQQLREQEQRLALQAAKLQAWEAELHRKQQQLNETTDHGPAMSSSHDSLHQDSEHRRRSRALKAHQRSWRMFGSGNTGGGGNCAAAAATPALSAARRNPARRAHTFSGEDTHSFVSAGDSTHYDNDMIPCGPTTLQRAVSLDVAGLETTMAAFTSGNASVQYASPFYDSRLGNDSGYMSLYSDSRHSTHVLRAQVQRASHIHNAEAIAAVVDAMGPELSPTSIIYRQTLETLGQGPMRFAPPRNQPSVDEQLAALDRNQIIAFHRLRQKWDDRQDKLLAKYGWINTNKRQEVNMIDLPHQWHLRYLHLYRFQMDKAWAAEKNLSKQYVTLNVHALTEQLSTKTLFPIPQLTTKEGHGMFYMRPSRFFPNQTTTKTIINNLCYVMNTMMENNAHASEHGIGFMASMDDWKMANFEVNYCFQFMKALQGFMIPVKVQLFLIVNPPSWFGVVWKIMKPMLAPSFRKKVKMIPESKVAKYLMDVPGLEAYLPDDMQTGRCDTNAMVRDFITYRQFVEQKDTYNGSASGDGYSDSRSVVDSDSAAGLSPSPHSSSSGLSFGDDTDSEDGDDNVDDEASIHCDISGEEHDDVKHAAASTVVLSNRAAELRVNGSS